MAHSDQAASVNADYRQQLLQLARADQQIRDDALKHYTPQQLQSDPGAARALALQIHASQQQNQQKLSALMGQYGFPDTAVAGDDGAHAGFLIAQHAADRTFRDAFLQGIEAAADKGRYSKEDLALFVDRNRVLSGRPQLYGTQHKSDGSLFDVEQPEQLQQRRAKMGLPPDVAGQ
ncbi:MULTISPECIES: DUF6624 domain-containing protein [Xanthomonas]|uniref:DUF6624 domain-containing protein n=1 Tax=Xanthomonas TaxID=338 RepID=UPI001F570CEA|nr:MULTISPECIES: DUF6624 domain-containing protein [Xanthomonas]MCI2244349.1 hypothetical protein [Xanthomonas indica]UYC12544.1 hypothetical protein NUG21_01985 [Xanthomonas sp. CFBP 8445]